MKFLPNRLLSEWLTLLPYVHQNVYGLAGAAFEKSSISTWQTVVRHLNLVKVPKIWPSDFSRASHEGCRGDITNYCFWHEGSISQCVASTLRSIVSKRLQIRYEIHTRMDQSRFILIHIPINFPDATMEFSFFWCEWKKCFTFFCFPSVRFSAFRFFIFSWKIFHSTWDIDAFFWKSRVEVFFVVSNTFSHLQI